MKIQVLLQIGLFLLISSILANPLSGQLNSDCINALEVSKDYTLEMDYNHLVIPEDQDEMEGDSCYYNFDEVNEYGLWYRFKIQSSGNLLFDLIPIPNNDIDFILYKAIDGNCQNLEVIRCMSSGETIGQPWSNNEPCNGPTGLKSGEEDVVEDPGCNDGSNNYLAPVNVVKGEVYYLTVMDFTYINDKMHYLIRPGGTARY